MRLAKLFTLLFITGISYAAVPEVTINLLDEKPKKLKDMNRRAQRPAGLNLYGFGPGGLANASFDYFVSPKVALEGGGGFMNDDGDIGYFLGGRYHVFGNSFLNLTPYIGAYTAFHHNGRDLQNHSFYMPFGLHKIKKSGLSWSVELAYERSVFENNRFSGGFRLGYRF